MTVTLFLLYEKERADVSLLGFQLFLKPSRDGERLEKKAKSKDV